MPRTSSTTIVRTAAQRVVIPIFMNLVSITAATVWRFTPGMPGRIVSLDFVVNKAVTTAAKAATVTAHIGGTATTGGAVALTSAAATPAGTKISGSSITDKSNFDDDDEITLVGSSVTAFVEGDGVFNLTLEFGRIAAG